MLLRVALVGAAALGFMTTCGDGGGDSGPATGGISDAQLRLMPLPSEYLGDRVSDFRRAYADIGKEPVAWGNEQMIEDDFDPEDEREDIERFRRIGGYYQTFASPYVSDEGLVLLNTEVDLFADTEGASGYLRDRLTDMERQVGHQREDATLDEVRAFTADQIADETIGQRMQFTTRRDGAHQLHVTTIGFRRGRLLGYVAIVRADDKDVLGEVEALSLELDDRIQAVLRGEITPTPAASP